eukprot:7375997-Pyramimonas_sp.AAC.1
MHGLGALEHRLDCTLCDAILPVSLGGTRIHLNSFTCNAVVELVRHECSFRIKPQYARHAMPI